MSLESAIEETIRVALEKYLPSLIEKHTPSPEPAERVTTEQAAKIMGVSPITMAIWRTKGQGPDYDKIGRAVRYEIHLLEKFARQNRDRLGKKGRPRKAR